MIDPTNIPFPLLLTDCSAPGVCVGILGEQGWSAYAKLEGETGSTLFEAVKQLLTQAELGLEEIQSFAYCEGPGSTLGIRINSMALRTWTSLSESPKPIYAYRSLVAARFLITGENSSRNIFTVLSDFRKQSWNGLRAGSDDEAPDIRIVSADELKDWPRPRYFIQQRIHSPGAPPDALIINYDLKTLGTNQNFLKSFTEVEKPEVFQTTATEFKRWTPSRHR